MLIPITFILLIVYICTCTYGLSEVMEDKAKYKPKDSYYSSGRPLKYDTRDKIFGKIFNPLYEFTTHLKDIKE